MIRVLGLLAELLSFENGGTTEEIKFIFYGHYYIIRRWIYFPSVL